MNRRQFSTAAAVLLTLAGLAGPGAQAHGVAGPRVFVTTLTLDDPAVSDEASLPTVSWQRSGADDGPGPVYQTNVGFEFDKRITENFGLAINYGLTQLDTLHDKARLGADAIVLTAKYQTYVNAEHEFLLSVGVQRELGRTGSTQIGADNFGFTQPNLYFGKGLGDLPIGLLRPLAITGEIGYAIADVGPKTAPDGSFNNGFSNRWIGGISLQYSMPYLQSQVKDFGLPGWVSRLTPILEVSWSSPTRSNDTPLQLVYAPGLVYSGDSFQFAVEALIPGNKNSGSNVGVIAQLHFFFDDLFPNSLGKPVVDWFR